MDTNPFQSPQFSPGGMQPVKPRPKSIQIFGILNLVFGALGICGVGMSVVSLFVPLPGNDANPVAELMKEPVFRTVQIVMLVLGFIGVLVLIASGVGLLQGRQYGRKLAVGYGMYAIVISIVGTLVNVIFVFMPLMAKINALPDGPQKAGAMGGMVGGIFGGCVGLIYPVLVLYFMTRRPVIDALKP